MTPQELALISYHSKNAGWYDDLMKSDSAGKVLQALQTGKWGDVEVPWLTAGLGGLAGAGMGAAMGGQNRLLGGLAGGLLGAAGGYGAGGKTVREWLAKWLANQRNNATPLSKKQPIPPGVSPLEKADPGKVPEYSKPVVPQANPADAGVKPPLRPR